MVPDEKQERFLSKLTIFRIALSGALVAVAIAEVSGLSAGVNSQLVAGTLGAVAFGTLKAIHFI